MKEKVFFDDGKIKITNSEFYLGYHQGSLDIKDIASVKVYEEKAKRLWSVITFIVSLAISFSEHTKDFAPIFLFVAIGAVFHFFSQKTFYHLILKDKNGIGHIEGKSSALKNLDKDYVDRVAFALKQAIDS